MFVTPLIIMHGARDPRPSKFQSWIRMSFDVLKYQKSRNGIFPFQIFTVS
jgi:hypothetical protein